MKIITILLLMSVLTSCSENADLIDINTDSGSDPVVENSPLEGVVWQLSSYKNTNGDTILLTPSEEYWLGFRVYYSEHNVIGYIGCHSLFARYSITGEIISITVEQITTDNCNPANLNLNEFESFYLNTLTSIVSYNIAGNILTIQSTDSSVLVYERL